jgi:hypothetical protein
MKKIENIKRAHSVWHQFSNWLTRKYGLDLYSEWITKEIVDNKGKAHKLKYRNFNEYELSKRLVGYEVMEKINWYVKSSDILLIPHPKHGITIMFIPQCTSIQNQFFLYEGHYNMLMKELKEMEWVYEGSL